METQYHHFDLVRNTYQPELAKDLLLQLINDKLTFLKRTIFSMEERLGTDTSYHKERVAHLKAEKHRLEAFLQCMNDGECEVDISCPVSITVKKKSGTATNETAVTV